jgi:repressor LexA
MKKLTAKQREILDFIKGYIKDNNFPPTLEEIKENFSFSGPSAVITHLTALEKKGFIQRSRNISRGINVLVPADENKKIPVLGRVPAGIPIEEEENFQDYLNIDQQLTNKGQIFALRVKGESMKDAGILEGDYVIIEKKETAENGRIVVAVVNGEFTVKYFRMHKNFVELKPANPAFLPLKVKKNFSIIGEVIGVYRKIK